MTRVVTAPDLAGATMRAEWMADGPGFYEHHFVCNEHPALTKTRRGPRNSRGKVVPTITLYVDGVECEGSLDAVAAALTGAGRGARHRARQRQRPRRAQPLRLAAVRRLEPCAPARGQQGWWTWHGEDA